MNESPLRILLVEDNPRDADLLQEMLATVDASLEIRHVERLQQALQRLRQAAPIDVILLDLLLPDSMGLATLQQVNGAAANRPIVVLTGTEDEALGVEAVRLGAGLPGQRRGRRPQAAASDPSRRRAERDGAGAARP